MKQHKKKHTHRQNDKFNKLNEDSDRGHQLYMQCHARRNRLDRETVRDVNSNQPKKFDAEEILV